MGKVLYSTSEAAKILGISRVAVFQRIKRGSLQAMKVGRNYVIEKKALDRRAKNKKRLAIRTYP